MQYKNTTNRIFKKIFVIILFKKKPLLEISFTKKEKNWY